MTLSRSKHIKLTELLCLIFMMLTAIALPLNRELVPIILIVWASLALIFYRWLYLFRLMKRQHLLIILPVLLYVLSFISTIFFTENASTGWFKLEVKLSYIILPFIFLPAIGFDRRKIRYVLTAFIAGNLIASIICFARAFLHFSQSGSDVFYYTQLSYFHHTSYYALYLAFSLAALYYLYKQADKKPLKTFYVIAALFFSITIYFISSKAGLLSLIIVISSISAFIIYQKFSFLKLAISLFAIAGISFLLLNNYRLASTTHHISERTSVHKDSGESTQSRILVWKASLELVKENWVLGTSPGDASDELVKKYHTMGYSQAELKKLNCHNQYLETMVSLGLTGILLLGAILAGPLLIKGSRRHHLFLIFLVLVGFNFLFESMLEKQSGVVFFMFFYTFFMYNINNENNDSFLTTQNR
ncbi:MAG TPA: O-antigen ligase family protein [Bacteroidales bacterium]|nr:O-antigen ligase family protein [Bacteroidales bacterium]HQL70515.1 O-antigen ligase family protein [Bacteroidales bacterium]